MKLLMLSGVVFLATFGLLGCGGETKATPPTAQERILHLATGDYPESQYRANIRVNLTQAGGASLCQGIVGLSDAEVYDMVAELSQRGGHEITQEPDPADTEHVGTIVREECARMYP